MSSAGAAIPALERLNAQPHSIDALGAAVAASLTVSRQLQAHLGFAPLATKLAELDAAIYRVEPKRRQAVCKLGRGAANRAHVLAALDRLSLAALEAQLDSYLEGKWPELLEPQRERLAWYRAAIREQLRTDRGERREARLRAGTRTRTDRKPREARTHSRPVGSLAPPCASVSQLSTQLPRGRPPM